MWNLFKHIYRTLPIDLQGMPSSVFVVNFKQISNIILVLLVLTLDKLLLPSHNEKFPKMNNISSSFKFTILKHSMHFRLDMAIKIIRGLHI